jgi:hypothetical protein
LTAKVYVRNDPINRVDPDGRNVIMLTPEGSDGSDDTSDSGPSDPSANSGFTPLDPSANSGTPYSTSVTVWVPDPLNINANNNGFSGGMGMGAGFNLDLGIGSIGESTSGSFSDGLFYNGNGKLSVGGSATGAITAFSLSSVVGSPQQTSSTVFSLGAYAGAGVSFYATNAGTVLPLSGPFWTLSINVGYGLANLGVQIFRGNGIWQVSVTPPILSIGIGAAGSVVTTNTVVVP